MKKASLNVLLGSLFITLIFYLSYFATYFYKIIPFTDLIIFRPSLVFGIVISYLLSKSSNLDIKKAVSSFFLFLLACIISDLWLNLYDFVFKDAFLVISNKLELLTSFIAKAFVIYVVIYSGIKLYLVRLNEKELLIKCLVLTAIFFIYKLTQNLTVSSYYTTQIDEIIFWFITGIGLSHQLLVADEDCNNQDKKCLNIKLLFQIIITIAFSFLLYFGVATSRIRSSVVYVKEITIPNKLGFYVDDLSLLDLKNEVAKVLQSERWIKRDGKFNETDLGKDSRIKNDVVEVEKMEDLDLNDNNQESDSSEEKKEEKEYEHSQIEVSVLRKDTKRFFNQSKMNELSDINQAEFKLRYETDFSKLDTEDIRSKTNLNVVGKDFVIEITEVSMPNTEGELIQMFCGDLVKAVSKK